MTNKVWDTGAHLRPRYVEMLNDLKVGGRGERREGKGGGRRVILLLFDSKQFIFRRNQRF